MTQPTAQSVMRNRAAVAEELRRLLPKMERFRATRPIPFGLAAIDRYLPQGGLACGALHEVVPDAGATPAAFGFLAALLARVSSPPHPNSGVPEFGQSQSDRSQKHPTSIGEGLGVGVILAETAHRKDTLWAMEEALRSRAPAAVAGVIDQLDLKTSQRLHLAATDCGLPLFLLRPAEILEASAAATRWRVGPAPAARDRFGQIIRARWRLKLERCRNGRAGEWMVEYDHVAHRFSLAAALADPAFPRSAGEEAFRQAS